MKTIMLLIVVALIMGCENPQKKRQAPQVIPQVSQNSGAYEPIVKFQGNASSGYDLYMISLKEEYDAMDKDAFPMITSLIDKHLKAYFDKKEPIIQDEEK